MTYSRKIGIELDQQSINAFRADMQQAFARAAAESGAKVFDALKGTFDRTIAELKTSLAEGVIDQREFKARAAAASQALAGEMQKARAAGKLTDQEYIKLSKTLKATGQEGKRAFRDMEGGASSLMGALKKVGGVLAGLFAVQKLGQFGQASIRAALEAEGSARRIEAVWRATGNAVGKSVDQLLRLSDQLERSTLFNKVDIEEAMAQLLTYKSIAGDSFDRTIHLAMDMSTVFGGLAGSTQALAKALDDPIRGLGMLAKAGYTFDDSVVQQIQTLMKFNRQLEAQQVILSYLEGEVGGVARQMKSGWAGAVDSFQKAWGRLKERIGEALLAASAGPSIMDSLTAKLAELEGWVVKNKDEIGQLTQDVLALTEALAKLAFALSKPFRIMLHPDEAWRSLRERLAFGRINRGYTGGMVTPEPVAPKPIIPPEAPKPTQPTLTPEQERALREEREKALEAEIAALKRGHELRTLTARDIARASDLEAQFKRALDAGNVSLERRNQLTERLATLAPITPDGRVLAGGVVGDSASLQAHRARLGQAGPVQPLAMAVEPLTQAADEVASAWVGALQRIEEEVATQRGLFGELADAWVQGGIGGLLGLARAKAQENLARAIEEGAKALGSLGLGYGANAAAHFKAAKGHAVAAAAWGALGGTGGRGNTGAALGAPRSAGGRAADRSSSAPPEIHIYMDPLSPSDPRFVRVVAGARAQADRYLPGAGANVTIQPRTR
jgi:hypothetical protein